MDVLHEQASISKTAGAGSSPLNSSSVECARNKGAVVHDPAVVKSGVPSLGIVESCPQASKKGNQKSSKVPSEVRVKFPEFLCNPSTDLNFDLELSSAETKDFFCSPQPPISKTTGNVLKPMKPPQGPKQRKLNRSLDRFLKNHPDDTLKLFADDYTTAIFDRVVESLYGNTVLKTIEITRNHISPSGSRRSLDEMLCLMEAIRCLPRLKALVLSNIDDVLLPTLVANLPPSLVSLKLHVLCQIIPDDILDALNAKKKLKHLHLEAQGSINFGRLVKTGSKIHTLKILGAYFMDSLHLQFFADTLFKNAGSSLRLLDIQPIMDVHGWKALTDSLLSNTQMQVLRVNLVGTSIKENDSAVLDLAKLLNQNATLRRIDNHAHNDFIASRETLCGPVVNALQANTSLHALRFFQEDSVFWVTKFAFLNRNKEKGEVGKAFSSPYANLAGYLPAMQNRLCADE
jgi:hypothetical protein